MTNYLWNYAMLLRNT